MPLHCILLTVLLLSVPLLVQGQGQESGTTPFTRQSLDAMSGQALAEKLWVAAPASTRASDGLGPYYNARSCTACHPRGGQGRPYDDVEVPSGQSRPLSAALVLHLPLESDRSELGRQLQVAAVAGMKAEVVAPAVRYTTDTVTLDGEGPVRLRVPDYEISSASSRRPEMSLSPRLAPDLRGVALLNRIPDSVLLANADPTDADQDGISGRVGRTRKGDIGRFGWRAQAHDLEDQVARAFSLDMGLGSPLYPDPWGDCTPIQEACRERATAGGQEQSEVSGTVLELILRWLSSPAMLPSEPGQGVDRETGRQLFRDTGCGRCHIPAYTLQENGRTVLIQPYTDLLLHDMGSGLADQGSDGEPPHSEWRTPPLWGLHDRSLLLHDGRARSIQEAILWHDGEAADARGRYQSLPPEKRAALLAFLEAL